MARIWEAGWSDTHPGDARGGRMGTKDKGGGKASKKQPQKSLKQKREAKKQLKGK